MIKEVVCIQETRADLRAEFWAEFKKECPFKGNIYTVIDIQHNNDPAFDSPIFYELAEVPPSHGCPHYFGSKMFADLPEDLIKEIEEAVKAPVPSRKLCEPIPAGHELDAMPYITIAPTPMRTSPWYEEYKKRKQKI